MAEQYDAIVIGGGHNGLTAALELARASRSVLVVERQAQVGGCAKTIEPLLPGFRHSPHANTLIFADIMPDFIAPKTLGVQTYQPEAQLGVAFADGRPPVILHRPDLIPLTMANFGVYSARDAKTYEGLKRGSARFGSFVRSGLYAPPERKWFAYQAEAVGKVFRRFVDRRVLGQGSARSLIDSLFETDEIRIALYHLATETGLELEERGGDVAFLSYSLWIAGRWRIPIGGMGRYTAALRKAAETAGVAIVCQSPVKRIIVDHGRAVGIEVEAGTTWRAAEGVVAATPLLETFGNLVPDRAIGPAAGDALSKFRRQTPASIATSLFCLPAAPKYKSADHDPAIGKCLKTVVGHESTSDVLAHADDVRSGLLPKPAGIVRVHSQWDKSLAPEGQHVAGVDSSFPTLAVMDSDRWGSVEGAFPQAFLGVWRATCRGDAINPMAMATDLTAPFERRMLLRKGPDQYRTGTAGLYLAGPGTYPGGGVHGACGRNAALAMIADASAAQRA